MSWSWPSGSYCSSLPSAAIVMISVLIGYILFEIGFFFHHHHNLIPFANQFSSHVPPAPYRDYRHVNDRVKLLTRMIDRIVKQYQLTEKTQDVSSASEVYYKFIESWFCKRGTNDAKYERFSEQLDLTTFDVGLCPPRSIVPSLGSTASTSSPSSSNDSLPQLFNSNDVQKNDMNNDIGKLRRDNMDEFLSWAFFGIDYTIVEGDPEMKQALDHFYTILQSKAGLHFDPGRNDNFTPRWFTFERVNALYRPFGVYAAVALLSAAANLFLYVMGFRRYTCKRGLTYWHRSSGQQQQKCGRPFLFFHGIVPGGHVLYIPMVLFGLLRGKQSSQRDIFFFENKPISYALCFDALTEEDTVDGVVEAIHQHLDSYAASNLTLCGHSFGSFQLTWMINASQLKHRVRSMILLDPVSILLHEPDVVVNFLYTRNPDNEDTYNGRPDSLVGKLIRFFHESKIQVVASSELFVEYYLRRNFAWYNSELWLEDIPKDTKVLVALAKNDEIVNAKKIEREISRLGSSHGNIKNIVWCDVGHAHCVSNPDRWSDIRTWLEESEEDH